MGWYVDVDTIPEFGGKKRMKGMERNADRAVSSEQ